MWLDVEHVQVRLLGLHPRPWQEICYPRLDQFDEVMRVDGAPVSAPVGEHHGLFGVVRRHAGGTRARPRRSSRRVLTDLVTGRMRF